MAPQRLLPSLRTALRLRHFSARTERAYVFWARRYVLFCDRRHPAQCSERDVVAFLEFLVRARGIAAATQNQAVAALSFLYRDVLGRPLATLPAGLAVELALSSLESRVLVGGQAPCAIPPA